MVSYLKDSLTMLKKYFFAITILIIVIITTIFLYSFSMNYKPKMADLSKQQPDAFMENVVASIMDKEGRLSIKMTTPKMIHYAKEDTTYFTTPQLLLYRHHPTPWSIKAEYAKASHGLDNILFWQNVKIHQSETNEHPATFISTQSLTVKTNEKKAMTNDAITLMQPNLNVDAIGLQADMNTGDIRLLSQARGKYVPS